MLQLLRHSTQANLSSLIVNVTNLACQQTCKEDFFIENMEKIREQLSGTKKGVYKSRGATYTSETRS